MSMPDSDSIFASSVFAVKEITELRNELSNMENMKQNLCSGSRMFTKRMCRGKQVKQ